MRLAIISIAVVWIGCFPSVRLCAQTLINDAGEREKHFIYEVKQIDEFFERFNDDDNSFVRKVYAQYHVRYNLNRAKLIKSLFNYETKSWNAEEIDRFVNAATNTQHVTKLDFFSNDWYAEAKCKFQQNGTPVDVTLILKIDTDSLMRSKWVVVGVKSNLTGSSSSGATIAPPKDRHQFINPASHANNFIELEKAFEDKENLADYFDGSFFKRSKGLGFYDALFHGSIKFLYVKSIRYHFLQMDKWVFTVEYFPREALNSGWLISSLQNIPVSEVEKYRKALLGE